MSNDAARQKVQLLRVAVKKGKKRRHEPAGKSSFFSTPLKTNDTLSLGDRTIDNMDRHAIQTRPRQQMLDHSSGPKSKPEPTFDFTQNSNVTALIGKTAYLTCRVRNLGDKTVSWVRHRDIHILTAGAYTYTSDQRFQALHRQNTGHGNEWSDWTLCIKWAQERDQGIYECQISTIPIKSYQFHLNVVVPTATILGGPELYVGAGSTINLTCAIRFSSEPPAYIFWYYNENVLSYDSPRGGVSVITEKGGDVTTSWLLIQTAQPSDSGEYSCKPSNANTASIRVHVLNDYAPLAGYRILKMNKHTLRKYRKLSEANGLTRVGILSGQTRPIASQSNVIFFSNIPETSILKGRGLLATLLAYVRDCRRIDNTTVNIFSDFTRS
ncbi:Peroxidasin like protein [Atta colombica]|uniref:Peroxidasin like protein n=1 Tax=Atta colombica TaxID=520822 RepID=A0A195B894_9HYME|nr:Peroxidasin like protein [Atta colombica]